MTLVDSFEQEPVHSEAALSSPSEGLRREGFDLGDELIGSRSFNPTSFRRVAHVGRQQSRSSERAVSVIHNHRCSPGR